MTKTEILEIINSDKKGYYVGTRLILPFKCNLIKLIADNEIYSEFVGSTHVKIAQTSKNTSVYFREVGNLNRFEGSYKYIKLMVASEHDDLTDKSSHIKLVCKILDDHEVEIEVPGDDVVFLN